MTQISEPIIVEQTFHSSVDKIWKAITLPEEMRQWFFDNIPSFEPIIGFETDFNVQADSQSFHHLWKIIEVEQNRKIKYLWTYKDIPGKAFVTFELFEKNGHTTLRLTNEGLETFPRDIPEFTRESCEGGWNFFIKKNLKAFVDAN